MLIFVIFIVGEYSRFYSVVLSLSRKISTVLFQKLLRVVLHGRRTRENQNSENQNSNFFVRGQHLHGHADKQKSEFWFWNFIFLRFSKSNSGFLHLEKKRILFGMENRNKSHSCGYCIFHDLITQVVRIPCKCVRGQKNQNSDFSEFWFRVSAFRARRP